MKALTRHAKGLPIVPDMWPHHVTKSGKTIFGKGRYKRKGPGYEDEEGGTFPRQDKAIDREAPCIVPTAEKKQ